jgi:phosphate transport system substrate-binding protein
MPRYRRTHSGGSAGSPTGQARLARVRPGLLVALAALLSAACGSITPAAVGASGSPAPSPATVRPASSPDSCSSSAPGGVLSPACDTRTPPLSLTGAGANSIYQFFAQAFYSYHRANKGVSVNYSPAGSGVGVTDIRQGTVSFADSEIPIPPPATGTDGPILQVPVDLGGVALSYNLPGVANALKLDGPTLAGIFLGTITNWHDPAIAALNPGVPLPKLSIVAVHRADSSGPGYDLDQYLIDAGGPAWTSKIGTATANTHWPVASVGVGEQLNTGVASYIRQTAGAIGYVEYAYAREAGYPTAALKNAAGAFVVPSQSSIAAAGAQAAKLTAANFDIVNGSGAGTYPLANFSWALLYRDQKEIDQGIVLGKLLDWVTTSGQSRAGALGYSPLPAGAVALAHRTLATLQTASGQPIF